MTIKGQADGSATSIMDQGRRCAAATSVTSTVLAQEDNDNRMRGANAYVIDGDILVTPDGAHWHLAAFNAPKIARPRDGRLTGKSEGEEVRRILRETVDDQTIAYTQEGVVGNLISHDRDIGFGAAGGEDLGLAVVGAGPAGRWTRLDVAHHYEAAEQTVRRTKSGIWAGGCRRKRCQP